MAEKVISNPSVVTNAQSVAPLIVTPQKVEYVICDMCGHANLAPAAICQMCSNYLKEDKK